MIKKRIFKWNAEDLEFAGNQKEVLKDCIGVKTVNSQWKSKEEKR